MALPANLRPRPTKNWAEVVHPLPKAPTLPLGKGDRAKLDEDIKVARAMLRAWQERGNDQLVLAAIEHETKIIADAQARIAELEEWNKQAPDAIADWTRIVAELEQRLVTDVAEPKTKKFIDLVEKARKMQADIARNAEAANDPDVLEALRILQAMSGSNPKDT